MHKISNPKIIPLNAPLPDNQYGQTHTKVEITLDWYQYKIIIYHSWMIKDKWTFYIYMMGFNGCYC